MKRKSLFIVLFVVGFAAVYMIMSFAIPGFRIKKQHGLVFFACQLIAAARGGKLERPCVQRGVAANEDVRLLNVVLSRQHPQPCQQFPHVKGLCQIVVCSSVQAGDFVIHLRFRRQEQYRRATAPFPGLDQYRNPVHHRHHDIENRRVV